jgi:TPR repeat protein
MIEDGQVLDVPSSQRLDRAVQFYQKSANKGNTDAMTDLGFLNEKGLIGTESTHLRNAVDFYKMAIDGHNPRAMNNLAGLYLAGKCRL